MKLSEELKAIKEEKKQIENKYHEALNKIFEATKTTLDVELFKNFDVLEEIIREQEKNDEIIFKLNKALDEACDYLGQYHNNQAYYLYSKHEWKEFLLGKKE